MELAERIMAWAIPSFFVLIALELVVAKLRGQRVYYGTDAINSLSLGVISQIVGVFSKLLTVGIYAWCVQRLALFHLPANNVWMWISGLVFYDFCYYWQHRGGHAVNILWAAHVVHHQSESFNLTTALRQTGSGVLLSWIFYIPMAIVGYPVEAFVLFAVIDLLYQFWVHTEVVRGLGWFDKVFCSPSNHRAHHGVNDRYIDKNYGGILMVWDHLFGSFVDEDETDPPVFGTRSPLRSWDPLWANAEVYWAMFQDAWHARRWIDKLQVWLRPPGWRPADVAERFPKPAFDVNRERYEPALPRGLTAYSVVQFGLLLVMGVVFLDGAHKLDGATLVVYAVFLVLSLYALGKMTEGHRTGYALELARLVGTAAIPLITGGWFGVAGLATPWLAALVAVPLVSAVVFAWLAFAPRTQGHAAVTH